MWASGLIDQVLNKVTRIGFSLCIFRPFLVRRNLIIKPL